MTQTTHFFALRQNKLRKNVPGRLDAKATHARHLHSGWLVEHGAVVFLDCRHMRKPGDKGSPTLENRMAQPESYRDHNQEQHSKNLNLQKMPGEDEGGRLPLLGEDQLHATQKEANATNLEGG